MIVPHWAKRDYGPKGIRSFRNERHIGRGNVGGLADSVECLKVSNKAQSDLITVMTLYRERKGEMQLNARSSWVCVHRPPMTKSL